MDTHHPSRLLLWVLGGLVVGLTALMVAVAISNQPAPLPNGGPTEQTTAPTLAAEESATTSDDVDDTEQDTNHDLDDLEKDLQEIDNLNTSLDNEPEL